jgi:hypothetical protein
VAAGVGKVFPLGAIDVSSDGNFHYGEAETTPFLYFIALGY